MNIYDESTMEPLEAPDLALGYTYPGRRFVVHHDAVREISHLEIMRGTEKLAGGKGLRGKVIDVPASPEWDEYEDCLYYHPYTEEELAAMNRRTAAMNRRTAAMNRRTAATWGELAEAYAKGVASV